MCHTNPMSDVQQHSVVSEHAVKLAGGSKSLSVLATPKEKRHDDVTEYKLSPTASATLKKVVDKDLRELKRTLGV